MDQADQIPAQLAKQAAESLETSFENPAAW